MPWWEYLGVSTIIQTMKRANELISTFLRNLPTPGALPNENSGFGPHPCAHGNAGTKHREQIDLLHQQTGPVFNDALWDRFLGLMSYSDISFTSGTNRFFLSPITVE